MDKGTFKNFIGGRTRNRAAKVATLAAATSVLIAMVSIDASASSFGGTSSGASNAYTASVGTSSSVVEFRHGNPPPSRFNPTTTTTDPTTTTTDPTTTTTDPTTTTTTTTDPTTTTTDPTTTTTDPTTTTTGPTTTTTDPTTTTTDPTTTTTDPTTTTTVPASTTPQPVGDVTGPWNLVFDSEFSGTSLDTSQWSTGWFGTGITKGINSAETECMDPNQVTVNNGELDLTDVAQSETCGGVNQPNTSGMVTTDGKFSFTYGFMEAKIWMPGTSSIADWPAFWADGQSWPTDGEIDVVEGLSGLAQAHFHYGTPADPLSDGPLTGKGTYTGGWHTFGADWEPGSITYYYDGVDIGTFTQGITSSPMYLILDLATTAGNATPGTMRVAYVRVWQH